MKVTRWEHGWELWDLFSFLKTSGALISDLIYRGHSDAQWKLVPALYRREAHIFGIPVDQRYIVAERRMLNTFFDRGLLLLTNIERSELMERIIAQHYSVPTQLLDWTLDPFIALYFAVEDPNNEADGALYYVSPLSRIDVGSPVSLPFTGKLTKLIPPVLDERVRTQKSVFTLQSFGGGDEFVPLDNRQLKFSAVGAGTDPQDEVEAMGKIIIPHDRKGQIRFQLMKMGVDAALVYPGLQGIGMRIAAMAEIQKYGGDGLF